MPGVGGDKSHNLTPKGGKKGKRSFAGQKMEGAAFASKQGGGRGGWGNTTDEYEDDYEAWDDEFVAQRKAQYEEQKAAEKEYRKAEEAERAATEAFHAAQRAKKEALQKHAGLNPYGMLEVQGAAPPPDFDFAFERPVPLADPRAHPRHARREQAEFDAAIAEHRRIMHAEGLWNQPRSPHPCAPPSPHPGLGALALPHEMSSIQRQLDHEDHVAQLMASQQARQYHHDRQPWSMQPAYYHSRGPNERAQRQRFQPRGHARFGH